MSNTVHFTETIDLIFLTELCLEKKTEQLSEKKSLNLIKYSKLFFATFDKYFLKLNKILKFVSI